MNQTKDFNAWIVLLSRHARLTSFFFLLLLGNIIITIIYIKFCCFIYKQYANYHLISHIHAEIIFHIHFDNNKGNELFTHSDGSMYDCYDLLFSKVLDAFNLQNDNLTFKAMGKVSKLFQFKFTKKIHSIPIKAIRNVNSFIAMVSMKAIIGGYL